MSIVNVKCPNCGASIQLDNDREDGFCSYCGSKVKVQEAMSRVKIDKSGDLKNLLNLANAAIEASNGQEALDYANKTLEVDSYNSEAWYIKMQAQGLLAIFADLKCNEIITAGRKAIEYDSSGEMMLNVYCYYLSHCLNDLIFLMSQLEDTQDIKELYDANVQVNAFNASQMTLASDSIADLCLSQEANIIGLKLAVPDSEILKNQELSKLTCDVAKQFVYYQNAMNSRFNVYGTCLNDGKMEEYKQYLSMIKQGLPSEMQGVVKEESLSNKKVGCYIATAVYGSYNCPEVWTLRRFRDNTLAETWYGRVFVNAYYATSPTFVKCFSKTEWFKKLWKSALDRLVMKLQSKGFDNSPYRDRKW